MVVEEGASESLVEVKSIDLTLQTGGKHQFVLCDAQKVLWLHSERGLDWHMVMETRGSLQKSCTDAPKEGDTNSHHCGSTQPLQQRSFQRCAWDTLLWGLSHWWSGCYHFIVSFCFVDVPLFCEVVPGGLVRTVRSLGRLDYHLQCLLS